MVIITDRWYPSFTLAFYTQIEKELETIKEGGNMRNKNKRTKKLWKWQQKLYQDLIEKGTFVEVYFIDLLPRGDGDIKRVIGRIIEQKPYIFCVLEQHSTDIVRIKKSQLFFLSYLAPKKRCVRIPPLSHVRRHTRMSGGIDET